MRARSLADTNKPALAILSNFRYKVPTATRATLIAALYINKLSDYRVRTFTRMEQTTTGYVLATTPIFCNGRLELCAARGEQ